VQRTLVLAVAGAAAGLTACGSAQKDPPAGHAAARPAALRLQAKLAGRLPAPLQNPAVAAARGTAVLLGGLDSRDVSVADVIRLRSGAPPMRLGRLPAAVHDAGAASLAGQPYLFGGGNFGSSDAIVHVRPSGSPTVGRLPAPASDIAAASVGGTAYVVGGFDGTRPLDTIVAWRPGRAARVIARLPRPLRYPAVAAVGGRVLIGGGTDGLAATRDVYSFDPATRKVRRVARLPEPLTHAAGAALGDTFLVIGGRGASQGTQRRTIFAVDAATGRIHRAGVLPQALSDVGAAALGRRVLVVGGRDRLGRVSDSIVALTAAQRMAMPMHAGRPPAKAPPATAASAAKVDVYKYTRPGMLAKAAAAAKPLVYVPNSESNTVTVIDPRTYKVVTTFPVGALPHHVTPSWDMKTLWVDNTNGNSLTPIDPRTGKPGKPVPVDDPYNLYFTPDGRRAIVVAERLQRLDFREPHTMRLRHALHVNCRGVDHMDFTADGRLALVSCEFSGQMVVVDIPHERVVKYIPLRPSAMPQDVKLSSDGRRFYVADMASNGVWVVDAQKMRKLGFIATGRGTHGLYVSRDSRVLYITNRGEGSISLLSMRTGRLFGKWRIPGGGSPDMGGVSADGKVLWLSGRYNGVVYAISTRTGRLLARIPVGAGPHGLSIWPQPGRYSLGHTGVLR
jgi:YVTN family beta-propeller protein